jgi:hypothetical protein
VRMEFRTSLFFLLLVSVGLSLTPSVAQSQKTDVPFRCPVTSPNDSEPPPPAWIAERNREGDTLLLATNRATIGNGKLWATLPPEGVFWITPSSKNSLLWTRVHWWKGIRGRLTIEGKRLDGPAGPLQVGEEIISYRRLVHVPVDPNRTGNQSTGVIFPSEGCWKITGKIDDVSASELTFVVEVRVPRCGLMDNCCYQLWR